MITNTFTGRWSWSASLNQEAICGWCWERKDWFPPMACVTLGDWVANHTGAGPMLGGRWLRKSGPLCFQMCIFLFWILFSKREDIWSWVGRVVRGIWEELGKGKECNQNILHEKNEYKLKLKTCPPPREMLCTPWEYQTFYSTMQ